MYNIDSHDNLNPDMKIVQWIFLRKIGEQMEQDDYTPSKSTFDRSVAASNSSIKSHINLNIFK